MGPVIPKYDPKLETCPIVAKKMKKSSFLLEGGVGVLLGGGFGSIVLLRAGVLRI